jgi:small-conductance mechanosensitive channel
MTLNCMATSKRARSSSEMSQAAPYKYPMMFLVSLLLMALPLIAIAQETQAPNPRHQAAQFSPAMVPSAPVLLDGEMLFQVRGMSAYPAEGRAEKISERIEVFASDLTQPIKSLRVVEDEGITFIFAGKQALMSVLDIDSRFEGGMERQVLTEVYLNKIGESVKIYREQRKTPNILMNTVNALAATGIFAFGWWGLIWIFRKIDLAFERKYKARVKDVKIDTVSIFQGHQIWAVYGGFLKAIWVFLLLVLLYAYLNFVLRLFPWTAYLGKQLLTMMFDPLRIIGKGIVDTIPDLFFLVILFAIFYYLLKFGKLIFAKLDTGIVSFKGFDQEWAWPTYRIFRALVIAIAGVMAYPHIPGSDSNAFKGVSIFLGLLLSMGSTSVISNIIAGYSLVYRRAFRVGDRIKVNEHLGDVMERRLLVTHLRSLKNEEIIVPNSEILNHPVINYSSLAKQQGIILHMNVGIGYETPWRQVETMLVEAADRTDGLLKNPPPFVLQQSLGDFCVSYELNAYCNQPKEMMERYSQLSQNILDVFNEHGVQIMTPAYRDDPAQPKIVPKDQWFTPPAKPPETNQDS